MKRVGTCESCTRRGWNFGNPSEDFSFFIFSLFKEGTAGMNYDGSQGFGDFIFRTLMVRPL